MGRIVITTLCVVAAWTSAASSAFAADLCVGKPGCFATVQAAVDEAQNGDTIRIGPGTFTGGITIDKDLQVMGVSAGATTIEGGGPVITIGEALAPDPPTVSISRVTITGGNVDSRGQDTCCALGGGVFVEIGENFGRGATVTISDSVITGNRAAPAMIFPGSQPPFALAQGGGIDSFGDLTLIDTRVTNNESGATAIVSSLASNAHAGGIYNHVQGLLTLRRSVVSDNHARASAPYARFAEAGGIASFGVLTIEDSIVSDNSAEVDTAFPGDNDQSGAFAGGIQLINTGSATVTRTIVRGNVVRSTNSVGGSLSASGGIDGDSGLLVLRDSLVERNRVDVSVSAPGATGIAFAGGVGIEGRADVSGTHVIGNEIRSSVPAGFAAASAAGLAAFSDEPVLVSDSVVSGNSADALSANGFALAQGGGVLNAGLLTLRRTRIVANRVSASGAAGSAEGGGLWNGVVPVPGFPAVAELALVDSVVTGNRLTANAGIPLLGGGIFTNVPFTQSGTVVAGNQPDGCFGC
jgi:hypothetical protein